jgi:hypothetical protein
MFRHAYDRADEKGYAVGFTIDPENYAWWKVVERYSGAECVGMIYLRHPSWGVSMPAAIAVPLILGAASLVSNNVNQKAALANNENQQTSSLANADNSAKKAQAGYAAAGGGQPGPFSSTALSQPKGTNPTQNAMVAKILQAASQGQGAPKPMASPAPQSPQSGIVNAVLS